MLRERWFLNQILKKIFSKSLPTNEIHTGSKEKQSHPKHFLREFFLERLVNGKTENVYKEEEVTFEVVRHCLRLKFEEELVRSFGIGESEVVAKVGNCEHKERQEQKVGQKGDTCHQICSNSNEDPLFQRFLPSD